jgi:putative copper resistance protein D
MGAMNALFVAARAVHYASALVLLGELVFAIAVAPHGWHKHELGDPARSARISRVMTWAIVAAAASGMLWFVLEAAAMSGLPIASAVQRDTLALVAARTSFGRVWMLRAGLLAVLCLIAFTMRRSTSVLRTSMLCAFGLLAAALYTGALAWAGHAAAGEGGEDDIEMFGDVVHLLAAGAWLGSLPALVDALRGSHSGEIAARAARRFSAIGLASVSALIASGTINAWYQVGNLPALIGTLYGRLLLVKLALFAAMIATAVVNRGILAPRVAAGDRSARRALRRNAVIEIVLGFGVVAIVGRLGITVPGAHQPVLWPLAHTLSLLPIEQSAWMQLVSAAAAMVAVIGATFILAGILRRPPRLYVAAVASIALPVALLAWLLVVPAHPTTYALSPVGYTTKAVASGAALYASSCSACHGRDGRGDASAAGTASASPKDLAEQIQLRRGGDLFWSIAHGVAGTSMPAFASRLSEIEIWKLIEFLDAQSAARNAAAMTERVKPLLPVPAPDFTYELVGAPQHTLLGSRDDRVTLLVLYTLPQSLPRLADIAASLHAYAKAGARVVALAIDGLPSTDALRDLTGAESFVGSASADVGEAYRLFANPPHETGGAPPAHIEYLIDRQGQLRVRWIGIPASANERGAATLGEIAVLFREPPRLVPQWGHRH